MKHAPRITAILSLAAATAAGADVVTAEYLGPGNGQAGSAGTFNRFGQSFLSLESGPVTQIDLRLRRNGADPATVIVTLFETDARGLPAAELGSADLPVTLTPDFEWYTIDFSVSGVSLDSETHYAFMVSSISGDGGYLLETARPGGYADGEGLVSIAGGPIEPMADNFIYGDRDLLFSVRIDDNACPADLTGSADPNDPSYDKPDGDADADDFFFFLDAFTAANLAVCDLTGSSDPNDPSFDIPDGDCDADDFFRYLDLFVLGCP